VSVEDPRLRLAYDEGERRLLQQSGDLDKLRGRAVSLVSVAALAVGLLSGLAGDNPGARDSTAYSVGLWAFAALIVLVCILLVPYKWVFETDPREVLTGYVDQGRDMNETLRWLAKYKGDATEANGKKLDRLHVVYLAAVAALGIVVVSLALALTGK